MRTKTTRVIWKSLAMWPQLMSFLYKFLVLLFTSHFRGGRRWLFVCIHVGVMTDPVSRFILSQSSYWQVRTVVWVVISCSGIAACFCFMLRLLLRPWRWRRCVFLRSVGLSPNYKVLKAHRNVLFKIQLLNLLFWQPVVKFFLFPQVAVMWLVPTLLSCRNALTQFRQIRI